MSARTGGGFGGSYLAEHLLRFRRPRPGDMRDYLDQAHYDRVCASDRKRARRTAKLGLKPPQPQAGIPLVWGRY